jgi:alkylation response protein AidB-like acyl-CoA dehydrogenase
MSFGFMLTEAHQRLLQTAHDFAQREIAPVAAEFDRRAEFPLETVQKTWEVGFMNVEMPQEYGGPGLDSLSFVLACKEIAAVDASHAVIMSVNNSLFSNCLLLFGSPAQKENYLRAAAGEHKVGAYALTEPGAGSDPSALQCRAVKDGDEYILNGLKSWVTSGTVADHVIVFAVTDPEGGSKGITAFVVEASTPGFRRGKVEPKMGVRASASCELSFEDCRVPLENRIGEEGQGFKIAMTVMDAGRIGIAAQALGIAEAAYAASLKYARERQAFGQAIGQFQGVGFKLADMKAHIEAARGLVYNAAIARQQAKSNGGRYTLEASMAKLYASQTAVFCADQAVQIHGGLGYSSELPVERYYRDAKVTEIYEGTSEIQRWVISRLETGLK